MIFDCEKDKQKNREKHSENKKMKEERAKKYVQNKKEPNGSKTTVIMIGQKLKFTIQMTSFFSETQFLSGLTDCGLGYLWIEACVSGNVE